MQRGGATALLSTSRPQSAAQTFVGRERELELLRTLMAEAADGRGGLALLVGEPGIGKTRTARELAEEAARDGALVLWGRCFEGEWPRPYGPWAEALGGYAHAVGPERLRAELGPVAEIVAELVPALRAAPPERTGETSAGPDSAHAPFRLYEAVAALLSAAASERPVLVVLDDLHWADRDSLRLLRYVARSVGEACLLIVGAYREDELEAGHPLPEALADLGREADCERIVLGGLTEAEVACCLARGAGWEVPAALVRLIHAQTEGNPFYVRELFRHVLEEGKLSSWAADSAPDAADEELGVPPGVRHVVARRVARLSPEARELLQTAAAFPRGFELRVLRALAEGPAEELLDRLDEALRAGLICAVGRGPGRYRFSHAIVRQALYDELGAGRRVRLHRRIGEALERLYGADLEPHLADLAHHFGRALPSGDAARALDYARRAAERASRLLAYGEAADQYERALELLELSPTASERSAEGDEEQRAALLLELGDARWKAGHVAEAREAFLRAAEVARRLVAPGDADRRARHAAGERARHAAALLARAALGCRGVVAIGPVDPAQVGLLEEALAALDEGDSPVRVRLLARLAQALYFSQDRERLEELSRQAVEMAQRVGDKAALAHALVANHLSLRGPEDVEERLASAAEIARLAEEVGDHELAGVGHSWRFTSLLELGDLPAADAAIAMLARLAEELAQPFFRWRATLMRTMRALMEGRFVDAEQLAQQMLTVGRQIQDPTADTFYALHLFVLRRDQGLLTELHSIEATARGLVERSPTLPILRCWLALLEIELGREEAARRELDVLAVAEFADLSRDVTWLPLVSWLAELCTRLGDARRAGTLYRLLEPYAGRIAVLRNALAFLGSTSHPLGLLAALLGRHADAARHFEDALAMHARLGARPLLAHTRHEYAALLLAGGGPEEQAHALELLDLAFAEAAGLGMALLAERAATLREGTRRLPGASEAMPRPDGLSPREVDVLRLIALGRTTREIADDLVVAVPTVERHITNLYGKIGARGRAEATAYALHHGLAATPAR